MKKLLILFFVSAVLFSCKKNYTCSCSTPDPHQGFINQETYHVKEKSENNAMANCSRQFEASGKATNGIYCDVSKN